MVNNNKLVLSLFSRKGVLSISDVAENVHLSTTTITKIIRHLEERKLIVDCGKGDTTKEGGKRPALYKFNESLLYSISVLTDTDRIIGTVHNLNGKIIQKKSIEDDFNDYQYTLDISASIINQLMDSVNISEDHLCGIAIACEGVIDSINGIVRCPIHHKNWGVNRKVKDDLGDRLQFAIDIYVENPCCYAGFHEVMKENFHKLDSLATINTIDSTGGCVIRDKSLIKGKNGFIGEFGHIIIDYDSDIECICGGKGCFEALVAPRNILKDIQGKHADFPESGLFSEKHISNGLSMLDLFSLADEGDVLSQKVLDKIIRYFAILIHNISLSQDPDAFIIQGVYANPCNYFRENLIAMFEAIPFYRIKHNIKIFYTNGRDVDNFLTGAAYYIFNHYFNKDEVYI